MQYLSQTREPCSETLSNHPSTSFSFQFDGPSAPLPVFRSESWTSCENSMCVISVAILRKEQAGSEAAQAQLLHNDRSILGHLADRAPASCSCGGPHKLHSGAVARAADGRDCEAPQSLYRGYEGSDYSGVDLPGCYED